MSNIGHKYTINYRPNTTRNIGIGATYKSVTLNLAYGFGFLNPEVGRGRTRYLDMQFHKYGRKLILDLFGQFYSGYYMRPKGVATTDGSYYVRPDLEINMIGGSLQYVFNSHKFSYRAAFLQNEWQRKSAGSFILGIELYGGNILADSTIFPTVMDSVIAARNYHRVNFFEIGPSFGYAYTLVFKKHFFAMAAATVGLDLGNTVIKKNTRESISGLSTNLLLRGSVGYNAEKWALSVFYITNNVHLASRPSSEKIQLNTANFRIHYSRRFAPGHKVKKYLKVIN